jgi:hypothetical protein
MTFLSEDLRSQVLTRTRGVRLLGFLVEQVADGLANASDLVRRVPAPGRPSARSVLPEGFRLIKPAR